MIYEGDRTGMKNKAYVTLSFDDGRGDNYRTFTEILVPNNIPATLYVTTGYIERKCTLGASKDNMPEPMSIHEIIGLHRNSLFEIGAHGDMHKNDFEDIKKGREKLFEWLGLPEDAKIGFASPGSYLTKKFVEENRSVFTNMGFQYIRTGSNFRAFEENKFKQLPCKIFRRLGKKVHSGWLFKKTYGKSIVKCVDGLTLTSVPAMHDITVKELKAIVEETKRENAWVIIMFHSILKDSEKNSNNTWSYDYEKFEQFIRYLVEERDSGKVEILTTKDAFHIMNKHRLALQGEEKI